MWKSLIVEDLGRDAHTRALLSNVHVDAIRLDESMLDALHV
jgi:EAL domain-containing protein (putative c-di-GMP-specific phosphodiesterase class I)